MLCRYSVPGLGLGWRAETNRRSSIALPRLSHLGISDSNM